MSTMPVFVSCILDFRAWLFLPPPNFHNGPSLSEGLLAQQLLPLGPADGQDQSVSRVSDSIVSPF